MKLIPVQDAVGLTICHDITEIVPGKIKGTAVRRGHVVREEDISVLLRIGKEHLYIWEPDDDHMVHEDDAARRIAAAAAGKGITYGTPKEGRINFTASHQGLLNINLDLLAKINAVKNVTLATMRSLREIQKGEQAAGVRVIPLAVPEETVKAVEDHARESSAPLLSVLPFLKRRIAVVTTGSEVYHGRIKDGFGQVLHDKFTAWGSEIFSQEIVPDETEQTTGAILRAVEKGAEIVAVTGGMSVDPDDRTPAAIRSVGCEVITYGAPVFPGAMFMLGYLGDLPVVGLPGCVMYHRASIFDLIMPRILAGLKITAKDITALAHGGLCRSCPECAYPNCSFGR